MRIGGFQPSSLIDYPGSVSAIVFTVGCNFRCPYCHNPELVYETPDRIISEEEVLAFLAKRARNQPAVTKTRRAPTQPPAFPPEMLKRIVAEKLADYVAMDIKAPLSKYSSVVGAAVNGAAIRESIVFLLSNVVPYEFRTTIVRSQLSMEDFLEIGAQIQGAKRYFLQQFNPLKTLHPSFQKKFSYSVAELRDKSESLKPYVEHCEVRA